MHIAWKKTKTGAYAYLRESYWDKEKQAPRTKAYYLGGNLQEAEKKLREILSSGQIAVPGNEQYGLIKQLKESAPPPARKPKRDVQLESTLRLLSRQIDKYKERSDITEPLKRALEELHKLRTVK